LSLKITQSSNKRPLRFEVSGFQVLGFQVFRFRTWQPEIPKPENLQQKMVKTGFRLPGSEPDNLKTQNLKT
jgi:hypothetical protein